MNDQQPQTNIPQQRNQATPLLAQCQQLRDPEMRGKAFEDICLYLLRHGKQKRWYRSVHTWQQWAQRHDLPEADYGIDLVGITTQGRACAIQVKFRTRGRRFTYSEFPLKRFGNYNNLRTFVDCCRRYRFRTGLVMSNRYVAFDGKLRHAIARNGLAVHRMFGPTLIADINATPFPITIAAVSRAVGLPPIAERVHQTPPTPALVPKLLQRTTPRPFRSFIKWVRRWLS